MYHKCQGIDSREPPGTDIPCFFTISIPEQEEFNAYSQNQSIKKWWKKQAFSILYTRLDRFVKTRSLRYLML